MTSPPGCPPAARLKLLLDNLLTAAEQEALTRHLDGCPACQQALEEQARDGATEDLTLLGGAALGRAEPTLLRTLEALKTASGLAPPRRPAPGTEWALSFLAPPQTPGALGKLGPYEVTEILGHGGMGVVFKAFDPGLGRWVAVKLLTPHLANDDTARRRFAREGRAAAAVHHENVVAVHAVDEVNGMPFLVMEYVPGPSLEQYLQRHGPPDLATTLRLAVQMADALAAAHAAGLIHRDIKPANVLLRMAEGGWRIQDKTNSDGVAGPSPSAPRPPPSAILKISDFGLARAADEGRLTQSGFLAGTPMYMAPEQALNEPLDFRTDLFSLGSVLYTLCTGAPPFPATTPLAVLKQVCEATPRPVRELNPAVPPWLAAVIARLQAKRPADRFGSAEELADLLRRYLAHLENPATAPRPPEPAPPPRPPGKSRLRPLLILAGLAVLILAGVVAYRLAQPAPPPSPRAVLEGHDSPVWSIAFAPDGRTLASGGGDRRLLLWDLEEGGEPKVFVETHSPVSALAFAPDGDVLASGSNDGVLRLRRLSDAGDADAGRQPPVRSASVWSLSFAPGGRLLAEGGAGDHRVLLWDRDREEARWLSGHDAGARAVAFAPHGDAQLASGDDDGVLLRWDLSKGQPTVRVQAHATAVRAVAFSPDGLRLASGGDDQTVKVWDAARLGEPLTILRGHSNSVMRVVWSPDGRLLASASRDGVIKLWDPASFRLRATWQAHQGPVSALAFSPDGKTLASAGDDKTIKLWDMTPYLTP